MEVLGEARKAAEKSIAFEIVRSGLAAVARRAVRPTLLASSGKNLNIMSVTEFFEGVRTFRGKTTLNEPGVFLFSNGHRVRDVDSILTPDLYWSDNCNEGCRSSLNLKGGFTVRLTNVHIFHPQVSNLRSAVMKCTHGTGGINAYYSTPYCGAAIPFHTDPGTQIIFQLKGEKNWYFSEDECLRLQEGDILVIPLALRHRAETQETYSLHLTMMLNPLPELRVLEFLAEVVQDAMDHRTQSSVRKNVSQFESGAF